MLSKLVRVMSDVQQLGPFRPVQHFQQAGGACCLVSLATNPLPSPTSCAGSGSGLLSSIFSRSTSPLSTALCSSLQGSKASYGTCNFAASLRSEVADVSLQVPEALPIRLIAAPRKGVKIHNSSLSSGWQVSQVWIATCVDSHADGVTHKVKALENFVT